MAGRFTSEQARRASLISWEGRRDPMPRIWEKVERVGDCWLWTGRRTANGYGRLSVDDREQMVHRVVYERVVGPIPSGLQLDHLCRNRRCVNPAHLESVTHAENVRRAFAARAALRAEEEA